MEVVSNSYPYLLSPSAGILSHLCSSEEWQVEDSVPRQNVLSELERRVISWDNPTGEMVAYRFTDYLQFSFLVNFYSSRVGVICPKLQHGIIFKRFELDG